MKIEFKIEKEIVSPFPRVIAFCEYYQKHFRGDFPRWLKKHQTTYSYFEALSLPLCLSGQSCSGRMVSEIIRFLAATGKLELKAGMSDHVVSDMTRLFLLMHPSYYRLFRVSRGSHSFLMEVKGILRNGFPKTLGE